MFELLTKDKNNEISKLKSNKMKPLLREIEKAYYTGNQTPSKTS